MITHIQNIMKKSRWAKRKAKVLFVKKIKSTTKCSFEDKLMLKETKSLKENSVINGIMEHFPKGKALPK